MVESFPDKENSGMQAAPASDDMSITVNGQSRVPPGFRFHPTEEELLNYYLRKKVAWEKIDLDVIRDVDLNKLEPWDIQEKCRIGATPQNDWYFFSHKDKKYPTGTRTNRATAAGFWKATGRDKVIYTSSRRIGMRKTLVFYKGRAPHGQKSDWIMHEYRLDDHLASVGGQELQQDLGGSDSPCLPNVYGSVGDPVSEQLLASQEEGWVVCRVFKKKNFHKDVDSPKTSSASSVTTTTTTMSADVKMRGSSSRNVDTRALDQVLQYIGRSGKQEAATGPSSTRTASGFNNTAGCCGGNQNNSNNASNLATATVRANSIMRYSIPFDTGFLDCRFMKLPPLESPSSLIHSSTTTTITRCCGFPQLDHLSATEMPCCGQTQQPSYHQPEQLAPSNELTMPEGLKNDGMDSSNCLTNPTEAAAASVSDWVLLDRLVASHLNGQSETSCFDEDDPNYPFAAATNRLISSSAGDMDLWAFVAGGGSSSSGSEGKLCHRSTSLGPD